jgi:hypothetical protein
MYCWIVRVQTRRPSLSNSPRIRWAPHSRLSLAISLIKATISADSFGLRAADLDVSFQKSRKPWRCQREPGLRLDDEQGVLPGPNHPCQKHQEESIRFGIDGSFDVSAEDKQRLSQECVICHEFGLTSGKGYQRPHHERGGGVRFCPVSKTVVERLKAHTCQALDEGKHPMHSVYDPF